ncbi:MAG: hypothetical protein K2P92_02950, partial [Bdellovibrionaceae bacterium]|nr:hypothetical protein [Pseudobdellovibrionaceae bacterium]
SMTADQNQFSYLKTWRDLTYDQTIARLYTKISASELYAKLIVVRQNLGRVEMGLSLPGLATLADVKDSILTIPLPEACQQKQAVIRVDDLFYFHTKLIEMMGASSSARQLALLNFHEYVYYYGKNFRGHENSLNTQSLIVFLLTQDADAGQLNAELRKLNFIN